VRPDGYLADAASKAVIDWPAGMDGTGALARMGGNRGLMARATRAYVEDASAWPARVTALIAGSDWSAAERELHSFKGLSGTLGLTDLAGRAAAAESMAHHQDPDRTLVQAVAQIQAQLQRLSPALSLLADTLSDTQGLQSNRAANVSSGSGDSVVLPALAELLVLLKTSDMRAMELHATLPRGDNESVEVALAPLDAAMADLEFELAAQQCEKLIQQWKV
jgi:HPt (histidine-containing phosphotransfer) domain-containing protein